MRLRRSSDGDRRLESRLAVRAWGDAWTNNPLNASTVNAAGGDAYVVSEPQRRLGAAVTTTARATASRSSTWPRPAQLTVVGSTRSTCSVPTVWRFQVSTRTWLLRLHHRPAVPEPNVGNSFAVVDVSNPANPTTSPRCTTTICRRPGRAQALAHATAVAISTTTRMSPRRTRTG
jgi:hypothetical protein